jgi:hypothetical protein
MIRVPHTPRRLSTGSWLAGGFIACVLTSLPGCGLDIDENDADERVEARGDVLAGAESALGIEPEPAAGISAASADDYTTLGCIGYYVPPVRDARDYIANHCGGISGCGSIESSTHSDVFLTNRSLYCSCYSDLWSRRNTYPFNQVQIIYHETSSCTLPHIHIKTASFQNGMIRFDVDENADGAGQDCDDKEWQLVNQSPPIYMVDWLNGFSQSRKGTCDNP